MLKFVTVTLFLIFCLLTTVLAIKEVNNRPYPGRYELHMVNDHVFVFDSSTGRIQSLQPPTCKEPDSTTRQFPATGVSKIKNQG